MPVFFGIITAVFGMILLAIVLTLVLVPLFRAIGSIIRHIFAFIGGEIRDALRIVGAVVTAAIFSLLVIGNILIFRWSASAHFGRAFSAEIAAAGACLYRILIGHPARLLGLNSLVEGIERRVPDAVAAAPTADKPSRRTGQFEHYRIVGSLAGGGSGGKLYVAEPDDLKLAALARAGQRDVGQVVIKSFSLRDGSSLPQIVRESRALDAAKKLGLVLDHELTPERFFYVMRYVPGESLGLVTQHLHATSPEGGLSTANLRKTLGYMEHLLSTLRRYHEGGLWHKDVKPDNIIIHGEGAHLVDFGLITPLRSAMTLTTHGTEYFRDPEMVRMALKGVKVHEVDGAKFDIYAAGAVLYSVVENSFPAHGGLSQITKRCPDALRWIIRRAMTDYDKRYATAGAMLADLNHLRRAADPFAVKPAELPSVSVGEQVPQEPVVEVSSEEFDFAPPQGVETPRRATPRPVAAAVALVGARSRPELRLTNWWSGRYELGGAAAAAALDPLLARGGRAARPGVRLAGDRRPAAEQLRSARARAEERRARARERLASHRHRRAGRRHASGINAGVAASLFIFLAFCVGLAGLLITQGPRRTTTTVSVDGSGVTVASAGADGRTSVSVRGPAVAGAPVAAIVPTLPELHGRMLVANDLLPPFDPQFSSFLQSGLAEMQKLGVEVLSTLDGETDEATDDLLAELKKLRGLRPLDSSEVTRDLSGWLDEREEVDYLVWIEPGESADAPPRVKFFPPSEELIAFERLLTSRG